MQFRHASISTLSYSYIKKVQEVEYLFYEFKKEYSMPYLTFRDFRTPAEWHDDFEEFVFQKTGRTRMQAAQMVERLVKTI